MRNITTILLVGTLFFTVSCTARQPSNARAHSLISKHFVQYAKDYPESEYGVNPIREVRVLGMSELHKYAVVVSAELTHDGGNRSAAQCLLSREWPFAWRFNAWEHVGSAAALTPGSAE